MAGGGQSFNPEKYLGVESRTDGFGKVVASATQRDAVCIYLVRLDCGKRDAVRPDGTFDCSNCIYWSTSFTPDAQAALQKIRRR